MVRRLVLGRTPGRWTPAVTESLLSCRKGDPTRVLGVDPGTLKAGWAVLERAEGGRVSLLDAGVIRVKGSDPIEVRLNDKYVETGRDFKGTLAHELLGHGLEHGVAKKKGNDFSYGLYRGDETGALLVGARVEQELGMKVRNGRVTSYLRDPEAYYQQNMFLAPAYALGLSLEEMKDPVRSLQEHKELVSAHRSELLERRKELDEAIKKDIKNKGLREQRGEVQVSIDTQDESLGALDDYVGALEGDEKLLERVRKDAESEQFKAYQKALDEDAEYLRKALYPPKKKK